MNYQKKVDDWECIEEEEEWENLGENEEKIDWRIKAIKVEGWEKV